LISSYCVNCIFCSYINGEIETGVSKISYRFTREQKLEVFNRLNATFERFEELGLERRDGQEMFAFDVAEAILDNKNLIKEAGVGIGKSFGYLIPSLIINKVLNIPVVIATSTIQLQNQLLGDVEQARKIVGNLIAETVIGKGQGNYSCMKRAFNIGKTKEFPEDLLEKIQNGTVNERSDIKNGISDDLWDQVKVDSCTYQNCKFHRDCAFYKMRQDIKSGLKDIIIINQDLLVAHLLKVNDYRNPIIYENSLAIIVDEAHNLEEKTRNALQREWSSKKVNFMINNIDKVLRRNQLYKNEYQAKIKEFERCSSEMFNNIFEDVKKSIRENDELNNEMRHPVNVSKNKLDSLIEIFELLYDGVQLTEYAHESLLDNTIEQMEDFMILITELCNQENSKFLFWLTLKNKITIFFAPKEINKELEDMLFLYDTPVVATSATLTQPSLDDPYHYIKNSIGFNEEYGLKGDIESSPFPYKENARLFIADDIPSPTQNKESYLEGVSEYIIKLSELTNGRCLVLFTSKEDLYKVNEHLYEYSSEFEIIRQHSGSSQEGVISSFTKSKGILLATGSFWEGIDIKGQDLSQVIIPRL